MEQLGPFSKPTQNADDQEEHVAETFTSQPMDVSSNPDGEMSWMNQRPYWKDDILVPALPEATSIPDPHLIHQQATALLEVHNRVKSPSNSLLNKMTTDLEGGDRDWLRSIVEDDSEETEPVSYTHLTLPTICSV